MKQKDSDSEVTMPCHFGARQRLQNLANVHNPSKAHSDRLPSCLELCSWSLTMVMYAPCACAQGLLRTTVPWLDTMGSNQTNKCLYKALRVRTSKQDF